MRRDETIKLMNEILQEQCRLSQLDLIEAYGASQYEAGKTAARASESSPPDLESRMTRKAASIWRMLSECKKDDPFILPSLRNSLIGTYWEGRRDEEIELRGAAATAPSAPPKCNFVNGYCTRCNANEIESEAIGECVAAPSAPTALTICPICDRGVDRICDVLAVQIGTEWYHKPCSRFAGEHAGAVVLPAPTTQTRKEKR
jgi:hypothetical protein